MKADDGTLRRLMVAAQAGDKRAYAVLLEACGDWLRRYYAQKIAVEAVDGLVQDVLLSIHRKRASYDPARAFLPWLAAIARYRWIDRLRKDYRHAADELHDDTASVAAEDEAVAAAVSLERLMAHLSEKQNDAIQLVKIEGLSIREAAMRTGQSESAVKVNIHRGVKKMAALIEE
ncbi:MAG: RNA polymerase subunit sigma-24 [Sphingomonadales bacterium CG12_big_fil_rev_8_21_14_0_65_65_10]|jgi:RNA polymerase sigma factor (sigma-70 family)|uniref:sigma-70 family RNA polymerase sigma factor n=1 Tax=Blastomonas marina TaxID=1867408 RepID=UPI000CAF6EE6|nr:sigma-70 family RNA polymerase sigma factor [Blastomonas marina]PIW55560.1 MAG: RNA polymerase subunit sigma-24 [Sphingomonadales bacterium CG12_big_fil_rev_8_21_14_0_65_65_10]WPZ03686.1 sigma-70 family RNA polymerase sigma factor [Blastomonas marina]